MLFLSKEICRSAHFLFFLENVLCMVPMINLDKCLNLQVCLLRPEKIKIKVSTLLDKVVKQLKCVFGFFLFFFLLLVGQVIGILLTTVKVFP